MKTIEINGKEYVLEYSFAAVEHKGTVQKMFNIVSGAYLVKDVPFDEKEGDENNKEETGKNAVESMINGVGEMFAEVPHIVKTAFYSGLLENHSDITEDEAYQLMKQYMKENKISFSKLFEDIKECMENDGFFDLSGLNEMMENVAQGIAEKQKKKSIEKVVKE